MIVYYIMSYLQFIINYKSNFIIKNSSASLNPSLIPSVIPKHPSHGHTQKYLLSNVSMGLSKLSMLYTEEGGSLASSVDLVSEDLAQQLNSPFVGTLSPAPLL